MTQVLTALATTALIAESPLRGIIRTKTSGGETSPIRYVCQTLSKLFVVILIVRFNGIAFEALGLGISSAAMLLLHVALCTAVVIGIDCVALVLFLSRPRSGYMLPEAPRSTFGFAVVAVIGSVWEEICFRGLLLELARSVGVNAWVALLFSSALFGLQHLRQGRQQVVYSTLFGIMFGALYIATGDLVAVMLTHCAGNLFATFFSIPRMRKQANRVPGAWSVPF